MIFKLVYKNQIIGSTILRRKYFYIKSYDPYTRTNQKWIFIPSKRIGKHIIVERVIYEE
jgi:hypothetical protein